MELAKGDRVSVKLPGKKEYEAQVLKAGTAKAKVQKDSGGLRIIKLKYLTKLPTRCRTKGCTRPAKRNGYCKICFKRLSAELPELDDDRKPLKYYGIDWDKSRVNFKFATDNGISFYGWYRKMKLRSADALGYAIDIFAKRDEREYMLDPVVYVEDPRENPKSLDADILAAATKWYTQSLSENVARLDRLQKLAGSPRVHFKRLESLDRTILKLKEFRDVAIRAGGTRLFEMKGDNDSEPSVSVVVNFTMQAMGLKGKTPSLYQGAVFDAATEGGREKDRRRAGVIANVPDKGSVKDLVDLLHRSKDEKERRKIRATLRKMGHKGGGKIKE